VRNLVYVRVKEILKEKKKTKYWFVKKYTIKVYRIGLNDAFNWENQKYKKNNLQGCTTAVQLLKSQK
jgi:hypothetical protein